MVTILVAYDDEYGIGCNGQIPWSIPADLKRFKELTLGHTLIMGRKTWDSLPIKPLPRRKTVVISRNYVLMPDSPRAESNSLVTVAHNFSYALATAKCFNTEIFIVGGGEIYTEALLSGKVDKIILSKMSGTHNADTFFPQLGLEWQGKLIEARKQFQIWEFNRS